MLAALPYLSFCKLKLEDRGIISIEIEDKTILAPRQGMVHIVVLIARSYGLNLASGITWSIDNESDPWSLEA